MFKVIAKIYRKYPSCEIVEALFDTKDKAYSRMQAWGSFLYDSMRSGKIDTYGLELEED